MGPLRSRGWGSAPDALLSAPRFGTLVQIVWSGCADEEDFGYDPVAVSGNARAIPNVTPVAGQQAAQHFPSWSKTVIHIGDFPSDYYAPESDIDELKLLHELGRASEMRRAKLIQISATEGILYPPNSHVAIFDPLCIDDPIGYRLPGQTLNEGMFVIWPIVGAADLGGLQAGEGHYSRIWKERIRNSFRHTPSDLLQQLREGGIELRNLRSCVKQWCRPPSTVIHAPQQKRYFEILIGVLGIDHEVAEGPRKLRRPWWEYAWSEIGHARGEAIQTGLQEHEIVDEQVFLIANELLPKIQSRALAEDFFQIEIPPNSPLQGAIRFYKVRSIEEGFCVPDANLKVICDLDGVEQWRA